MALKSKIPRKQRNFLRKGKLHLIKHVIKAPLSPQLREKYHTRSMGLRVGDLVKIMKGDYKGQTGKIESIQIKKQIVYISNITIEKANGSKSKVPFKPSNLMILELNMSDKWRNKILERKNAKKSPSKKEVAKHE